VEEDLYKQRHGEDHFAPSSRRSAAEGEEPEPPSFGEYPSTTDRLERGGPKLAGLDDSDAGAAPEYRHRNIYDPLFSLEEKLTTAPKLVSKDRLFKQRSSTSSNEVRKTSLSFSKEAVIEGYRLIREIGRQFVIK
jgi:hypothetical protein